MLVFRQCTDLDSIIRLHTDIVTCIHVLNSSTHAGYARRSPHNSGWKISSFTCIFSHRWDNISDFAVGVIALWRFFQAYDYVYLPLAKYESASCRTANIILYLWVYWKLTRYIAKMNALHIFTTRWSYRNFFIRKCGVRFSSLVVSALVGTSRPAVRFTVSTFVTRGDSIFQLITEGRLPPSRGIICD